MNFLFTTRKEMNEFGVIQTRHNVLDEFEMSLEDYVFENQEKLESFDNFGIGKIEEWDNFKYYNVDYYKGE